MRFIERKPYPVGYEAPIFSGNYTRTPTLDMTPVIPPSETMTYPDVFVIRARVTIKTASYWTLIEGLGFGLEREDLYTPEGLNIRNRGRILTIILMHTGFCGIPSSEGMLPWTNHSFNEGDFLWRYDFSSPLETIAISSEDPLLLYPLGGYVQNTSEPLTAMPLYFFVEQGESSPSVRFLFYSDLKEIRGTGPLYLPTDVCIDSYPSPEAALLQKDLTLMIGGINYGSAQVNTLGGDGSLVDVVMMGLPSSF